MADLPHLTIHRMSVSFPSELAMQAERIVRMSIDRLSRMPLSSSVDIEIGQIRIAAAVLDPTATDAVNAGRIAGAIHRQIENNINHLG